MAPLMSLPPEVIKPILDQLPFKDWCKIRLTCRLFNILAEPSIYSTCYFEFCQSPRAYLLRGPREDLSPDPMVVLSHKRAVKRINIDYEREDELNFTEPRFTKKPFPRGEAARTLRYSHLDYLLPHFTEVTTVELGTPNLGWMSHPPLSVRIGQIKTILTTCISMKKFSLSLYYFGKEDLNTLKKLKREYNRVDLTTSRGLAQGSHGYPRLDTLEIELTDLTYNKDLNPTYRLVGLIWKLFQFPAKTVTNFSFEFETNCLDDDVREDEEDCLGRIFNNNGAQILILEKVETLRLSSSQGTLSSMLFSKFLQLEDARIKEVHLTGLGFPKHSGMRAEGFLSRFSNLKILRISSLDKVCICWADKILATVKTLGTLNELGLELCDPAGVGLLTGILDGYGSKYKVRILEGDKYIDYEGKEYFGTLVLFHF
ncbi:hypothetical protein TWF281_009404 [Arthrobotrys megalospora]